jgi:CHAD domain-containing protein
VRKCCKRIRGALRLVRPRLAGDHTYRYENRWFRDAARRLSDARDAAVLLDTQDELIQGFAEVLDTHAFIPVRSVFARQRRRIGDGEELCGQLAQLRARMVIATERIEQWRLTADGFEAVRPGLERTYRRARNRFREAYAKGTVEAFHVWRKRVKYHWYHCRLLESLQPELIGARRDMADRLAAMLGDEHDLAVFQEALVDRAAPLENDRAVDALHALASHRREELRRLARPLGESLLADEPAALCRQMQSLWESARQHSAGS